MKKTIVVPSYFAKLSRPRPDDIIFDHPTDVDRGPETLSRLLWSLKTMEDQDFDVVVLGVPNNPSIIRETERRVDDIVSNFKEVLRIMHFSPFDLEELCSRFVELEWSEFAKQINLKGYPNVRNICLLVPHLIGSDVVVLLDDDEIVTDRDFLGKAIEFLGEKRGEKHVWGKTGYYLYPDGGYRLREEGEWWKILWNKARSMNEAFNVIESEDRLNETTFALGGNMVLDRNLFEKVPFDPYIVRGEDVDYLMNAKMLGFEFPLDNELYVLHDSPKTRTPFLLSFKSDIYRFLYMREKMRHLNIPADSFDPYPGHYLKPDLEARIIVTWVLRSIDENIDDLDDIKSLDDFMGFIEKTNVPLADTVKYTKRYAETYPPFQEEWVRFMEATKGDKVLKDYLLGKFEY